MNSIVLNNVASTTVNGLIVQTLPSISKPLIRTQVEEIDGRDGDIVTKLGYSAYDKEITIGLHGNYNVNDVIAYFDSEGIVTFSNEPDKFYRYQILEQIDFERLIRYKTATVTFHVQPFKYSTTEGQLSFSGDGQVTNSGNTVSKPLITIQGTGDIEVKLNGIQVFQIALGTATEITIDAETMNAYDRLSGTFLNRLVIGDYDNFELVSGVNNIAFTGSVSGFSIERYSRWL